MFRDVCSALRAGLWLIVAVVCAGCAQAPQHAARDDRLLRLANLYGVCNVAVAVVRQRELQSADAVHGCAGRFPLARESVFEAASLSKPVFAYAVLKLVQQGKMALEAPVLAYLPHGYAHRYFPHLADSPVDLVSDPDLPAVTVRMALNHTSGLSNWANGPLVFDGKPGSGWRYSGEGYILLQRAVEAVTGEPLDEYMQRAVFGPLGMTHSAYTRRAALEKFIVPGTDGYGDAQAPLPFREPVAAFSLYTSAGDYGRFLAALLKDEHTLSQIVASPVPVSAKLDLSWGLGWGLEGHRGDVYLWQWGNNPGYRAFVMASPRTGDAFVMFTNSDKGLSLARPLSEDVFPEQHQVYRYHLLRDGLANWLCEKLDVCL